MSPQSVPPQSLEAEQHLLGALLVNSSSLKAILSHGLNAEDFYKEQHRMIFAAAVSLHEANKAIDTVTVSHALGGHLDEVGGKDKLSSLAATAPAPGNAPHYAEVIQQTALLRRLTAAAQEIQASVADRNGDAPQELAEHAQELIDQATGRETAIRFVHTDSGEITEACPRCGDRELVMERMQKDLDGYRLRLANAEIDADDKITEDKHYELLKAIHDLWRKACNHPRVVFDVKEFKPLSTRYRQHGLDAVLQAIAGAAYFPHTKDLPNGRVERYDFVTNFARDQSVLGKYINRAPKDWAEYLERIAPVEMAQVRALEKP